MPILIGQVSFAVLLSVCPAGLGPGSPWSQTKQEHAHNQELVSDVLSTHRREGTPYVPSHRWNRFHSKRGSPSAATVPLLFSVPGKHRKGQTSAGGFTPPTTQGHTTQTEWQNLLPAQAEPDTEIHHPIKNTRILLVSRLLEPVEDHAWKIRVFNLFQY